jgi:hypothetical protein
LKELIMSFGTKVGDVLVGTGALVVKASIKVGYKTGGFLGDVVDGGTARYAVEEVKVAALLRELDAEAAKAAPPQAPLAQMAQAAPEAAQAQAMLDQLQQLMAQAQALKGVAA